MRVWRFISARELAKALTDERDYPVSEDVVQRWKKRGKADPRAEDKVLDLLGMTKEAPRPAWAEGLEDRVAEALATRLGESPGSALEAELVRLGLLPAEQPSEEAPGRQDAERTGPRPSRKPTSTP